MDYFTIRKATKKDLEAVQKLNLLLFKYDVAFDETLNMNWTFSKVGTDYFNSRIESEFVYVAEANGKIIGYLAGSFNNQVSYSHEVYAELENMFVMDEWRRHGVGKALCQEFFAQCEQRKIKSIRVTASAKNSRAVAFYKNIGFEEFDLVLKRRF